MPTYLTSNVYTRSRREIMTFDGVTTIDQSSREMQMGQTLRNCISNNDWKVNVARGVDATNAYRYTGFGPVTPGVLSFSGADLLYPKNPIFLDFIIRTLGSSYTEIGPMTDPVALDKCVSSMKRKLSSKVGAMKALTPVVEFRDLATSVTGVANLTIKMLAIVASARKQSAAKTARNVESMVSEAWLTWNFGIAPLVQDVNSAVQAMEAYLNRRDFRVRLQSRSEATWLTSVTSDVDSAFSLVNITQNSQIQHKIVYTMTAGFDVDLLSSNNYSMSNHFGLDLKSVPASLYELTAFSWMAEYFVNVGAYLEDVFYTPPGVTKYISLSRKYTAFGRTSLTARPHRSSVVVNPTSRDGSWSYFDFERSALPSLPHISLRVKTFDEIGSYAVSKLLNLLAILRK